MEAVLSLLDQKSNQNFKDLLCFYFPSPAVIKDFVGAVFNLSVLNGHKWKLTLATRSFGYSYGEEDNQSLRGVGSAISTKVKRSNNFTLAWKWDHWEPTLTEPQFYMVTCKSPVEIMMQCISGGSRPVRILLGLNTVSETDNRFHICIMIVCDTHLESQSISLLRVSALQVSVETIFHSSSF